MNNQSKNIANISKILDDIQVNLNEERDKFGDIILSDEAISNMYSLKGIVRRKPKAQTVPNQTPTTTPSTIGTAIPSNTTTYRTNNKIDNKINKSLVNPNWKNSTTLSELEQNIKNCMSCPLGTTRNSLVFGSGNPNATIMLIGEAPGAEEDLEGKPFVGASGQLLTKIIESIHLTRSEVYIANIVKCRPPNNRLPKTNEVDECEPYLEKQIELINPEFILTLGLTATNTLLRGKYTLSDIRGKVLEYKGRKLIATYHPSALLRNPSWKRAVWEDVKFLRRLYDKYLDELAKNKTH